MKKECKDRKARRDDNVPLSRLLTPWMVRLSVVSLALLALLVPASLIENQGLLTYQMTEAVLLVLTGLWLFFLAEFLVLGLFSHPSERRLRYQAYAFLAALIPPLRIGSRIIPHDPRIWLPLSGWKEVVQGYSETVARRFYAPMALIALLVVPLLAVEYLGARQVSENPWLFWVIDITYRVIWFAFALEFVVRVSVTSRKGTYCKKHVLDLVIILLPLVAFLRILRVLRLANVARVEQLSRMSRIHRLRSGLSKTFRALIIVKVFRRSNTRALERQLRRLNRELAEKELEVGKLKAEIAKVEADLHHPPPEAQEQTSRARGHSG